MTKNKQTKNDKGMMKAVTFITMQHAHYLMDIHSLLPDRNTNKSSSTILDI